MINDTKKLVRILSLVFLAIGILGFFNDPVLGIFDVDTEHNVIHLLSGIVGFIMSAKYDTAKLFARGFGVIYGLVTVLGFMLPNSEGELLGFMHINMADNFLHLFLSSVFLVIGFANFFNERSNTNNTNLK
jgi:hypothetical protein